MTRNAVAQSLASSPIIGVVRTDDDETALRHAQTLLTGGLELVEVTFSVPGATAVVSRLLEERGPQRPPWIGMGTVTTGERAEQAVAVGAEFIVTPNTNPDVAAVAKEAGLFLVLGALTATEIVAAVELGADLVKVYPLPPVGGPGYLTVVRQPLGDVPMLAAGAFPVDDIPSYRAAGAQAFGMGATLLFSSYEDSAESIRRALALARGESDGG